MHAFSSENARILYKLDENAQNQVFWDTACFK